MGLLSPRLRPSFTSQSTAAITRLLGINRAESKVTEAEICSIIQEGPKTAKSRRSNSNHGRVFSGDRTVESIMTHRSEMAWIDVSMTSDRSAKSWPRRRQPLPCRRSKPDKLLGVVYLKDLFLHLTAPGSDIRKLRTPKSFPRGVRRSANAPRTAAQRAAGIRHHLRRFGVTRASSP